MKQKPTKSTVAGLLFGVAMTVSFWVMLGPVGIALGVPFAFLGRIMFRELDKTDPAPRDESAAEAHPEKKQI